MLPTVDWARCTSVTVSVSAGHVLLNAIQYYHTQRLLLYSLPLEEVDLVSAEHFHPALLLVVLKMKKLLRPVPFVNAFKVTFNRLFEPL